MRSGMLLPVVFFVVLMVAVSGCGLFGTGSGSGADNCDSCSSTAYYQPCPGEMCSVAATTFFMGCNGGNNECATNAFDANCEAREHPCHSVSLAAYRIDRTEVTVAAYGKCVDQAKCEAPYHQGNWNDRTGKAGYPIDGVTWEQATTYCAWAGKRLCTEAEWENAARGPDGWLYPWGNEPPTCDRAVYSGCDCGHGTTAANCPVGYAAGDVSSYGVQEMAGNVNEWVLDWFEENAYQTCKAGCTNPMGPGSSGFGLRSQRGGSFEGSNANVALRLSGRLASTPDGAGVGGASGVRCCKSL